MRSDYKVETSVMGVFLIFTLYGIMYVDWEEVSMEFKDCIIIIVPSLVTIIGFFVSFFLMKKKIEISTLKEKENIATQEMKKILLHILEHANMLDRSLSGIKINSKEMLDLSNHINDVILSFGSQEAINILKEYFYVGNLKSDCASALLHSLCLRFILFSQIKYEVSGIILKPNAYLELKYHSLDNLVSTMNFYIEKLKLNKKFKI